MCKVKLYSFPLGGRKMKRAKTLVFLIALLVVLVPVMPAAAITDGELDGNAHPYVVLLLMEVGGAPKYRCSGTLLSPTVLLTAGHCTSNYPDEPYSGMRVFTESDVQNGDNNYPYAGPNSVEAKEWHAHPLYETAPFYVHDVGVVILKKPIKLAKYGTLPKANQLDALKPERDTTFTAVGYGLQKSFPDAASWKDAAFRVRMVAYPHLLQINTGLTGPGSLLLSNNANTGGTCFGDSGGPNFLGDSNVVAGITSFGMNSTCGGTGGVFRTDRQDVLDFVKSYLKK
jgi:secreted trypsin-like serine protease